MVWPFVDVGGISITFVILDTDCRTLQIRLFHQCKSLLEKMMSKYSLEWDDRIGEKKMNGMTKKTRSWKGDDLAMGEEFY